MRTQGTTTVEIKSGYGSPSPTRSAVLKSLGSSPTETTFLGAHVVPPEWQSDRAGYLDLVTGPMLAAAAPLGALDRRLLRTGIAARVRRRRGSCGGPRRTCGRTGSAGTRQPTRPRTGRPARGRVGRGQRRPLHASLRRRYRRPRRRRREHRRHLPARCRVLHPFPFPDATRLLRAGVWIALATDCNPGTCYSSSMPFVIARPPAGPRAPPGPRPPRPRRPPPPSPAYRHRSDHPRRPGGPCRHPRAVLCSSGLPAGCPDRSGA